MKFLIDQLGKVFFKGTVTSREEAIKISSEFIHFLDKL
jgi:hypothetical protein